MIKRYLLTAKKEDKIENEIFFEMNSAEEMQLVSGEMETLAILLLYSLKQCFQIQSFIFSV